MITVSTIDLKCPAERLNFSENEKISSSTNVRHFSILSGERPTRSRTFMIQ